MTWQPDPDWAPLTAGTGQATGGVWRTPSGVVVKRLVPGVVDPRHHAYWERQALVAESGVVARTAGVRAPGFLGLERDAGGITLRMVEVAPAGWAPEALAAALGRFAACSVPEPAWGARDILRDRLRTVERRGGWSSLGADPTITELWNRRETALAVLDELPRVPTHGDAHPANLLGRDADHVIAIDWEQFGLAPIGFDLAYLLLATDTPIDDLVAAFNAAHPPQSAAAPPTNLPPQSAATPPTNLPPQSAATPPTNLPPQSGATPPTNLPPAAPGGAASPDDLAPAPRSGAVRCGAALVAAYTGISRAAWAVGRVGAGEHLERLGRLVGVLEEAVRYVS